MATNTGTPAETSAWARLSRQGGGLDLHSVSLQEAQELQRRVHELERKLEESENMYADIHKAWTEASAFYEKVEKEVQSAHERYLQEKDAYDSNVAEFKARIQTLQDALRDAESSVASAANEKDAMTQRISNYEKELKTLRKASEESREKVQQLEQKVVALEKELEDARNEKRSCMAQALQKEHDASRSLAKAESSMVIVTRKEAQLVRRETELIQQHQQHQEEYEALHNALEERERALEEKEASLAILEKTLAGNTAKRVEKDASAKASPAKKKRSTAQNDTKTASTAGTTRRKTTDTVEQKVSASTKGKKKTPAAAAAATATKATKKATRSTPTKAKKKTTTSTTTSKTAPTKAKATPTKAKKKTTTTRTSSSAKAKATTKKATQKKKTASSADTTKSKVTGVKKTTQTKKKAKPIPSTSPVQQQQKQKQVETSSDVTTTSIQNWYSAFQRHTFKTHIIELSDTIVTWLIADGIVLRNIEDAFPTREKDPYDTSDSWSTESSSSSAETGGVPPEELAEVYARVKDAIDDLGGRVIPKLQWSCPKDASWMMPNNTIQCSTPDEVFLLLKSSDRIAHDIEVLQQICQQASPRSPLFPSTNDHGHDDDDHDHDDDEEQEMILPAKSHVLAIRRWYDLKPGREFRCFVKNNRLIAISQRDVSCKYQHIIDHVDAIKQRIQHMYDTVIHTRFSLANFSFDCYVPEAEHASVRIIDFNPFHHQDLDDEEEEGHTVIVPAVTNPLLFTWEDIHALSDIQDERVEFRYIDQDVPVQPESALYGVPFDFVDTRQGSALTNLLDQANASWKEFESAYSP